MGTEKQAEVIAEVISGNQKLILEVIRTLRKIDEANPEYCTYSLPSNQPVRTIQQTDIVDIISAIRDRLEFMCNAQFMCKTLCEFLQEPQIHKDSHTILRASWETLPGWEDS